MIYLMEIEVNGMGEKFRCNFFLLLFLKIFYTIHKISLSFFFDFFCIMVYNIYIDMPKPALQGAALRCPAGRRKKNVDKCRVHECKN